MQHCQSLKDWQCYPLTVMLKRMLGISPDYALAAAVSDRTGLATAKHK